jgi:branched-chain amino acid transport system substrate-binding protein
MGLSCNVKTKKGGLIVKRILAIGFMLLLCLFITHQPPIAEAAEKVPYKIGAVLPLTGYTSWLGVLSDEGTKLKVEMINKAGGVNGHPLELITYDNQSKPEEANRVAQRLITRDEVVAIIGDGSVPIAAPVFALGNQKKVSVFFACGYAIDPQKELFSFNQAHPTEFAVASPFRYFKKRGMTKVAFLMAVGSLGELGSKIGNKVAAEYGLTVVSEEKFETQATDVTPQLTKLRGLKPDVIFSFSTGEPAAMVARNMAQLNMNIPLLVSHGNATPGFLKMVADLPTMVIVPSGKITVVDQLPDIDPAKKVLQAFNKQYMERFKAPATYFAGQSADGIALIAEGLKIAGSSDPVKLRDALEGIKNFVGNNGVFNMSPKDHQGTRLDDMVNVTIKNGKWQLLE